MGKFIAVEGLPGSYKTTIVRNLKQDVPSLYALEEVLGCTIPPIFTDSLNILMRDVWHLLGNIKQSLIGRELTKKGYNVISDRYILSTLAFSYAVEKYYGVNCFNNLLNLYEEARKFDLLTQPDLVLYISVTPDESIKRQVARDGEKIRTHCYGNKNFLIYWKEYIENYLENSNLRSYKINGMRRFEQVYKDVLDILQAEVF